MRRTPLALAVIGTAALLLAACQGTTNANPASTDSTSGSDAAATATPGDSGPLTLTDVTGRTVELDEAPDRIVFNESRQIYSTLILNPEDPLENVVAWGTDLQRAAPDIYERVLETVPGAAEVPTIGSVFAGDLTVESVLSYTPDLFVMTLDAQRAAQTNGLLAQFDQAGVKYVVTDFRVDPVANTETSIELLGQILQREDRATEYLEYYRGLIDPVLESVDAAAEQPTSLIWRAPGLQPCCASYGNTNFGLMLDQTGGENIGAELLPSEEGILTVEQVIASQPDIIVATGGAWSQMKLNEQSLTSYLDVGYDTTPEAAQASLRALQTAQPGLDQVNAFSEGDVFGIYHQFYDAPFNFMAYLAFAKWQHPELTQDLDLDAVWKEFHERFMPYEAEGTFWVGIND